MNADGSNRQNLTNSDTSEVRPVISQDGSLIVFSSFSRPGVIDLFLMNPDGSNRRNLTDDPNSDAYASWSPDGSRLVFASSPASGAGYEIWAISVSGAGLVRLTSLPGDEIEPVWQPLR
jgi:Tol biopolymer transport system component